MKPGKPLLVVEDMERTKRFYSEILGMQIISDYGENIVMTGGICFQTRESWEVFLEVGQGNVLPGRNNVELNFEADALEEFLEHLSEREDIRMVHPVKTHSWGQRVVRFYDPDGYIIEVGESMSKVCKRFYQQERMSVEEIQQRMDIPREKVETYLAE